MKQSCYVCKQVIQGEPLYLGADKQHPEGLYRHKRCEPGMVRWFDAQDRKPKRERSALYEYFKLGKDGE